jgi:Flp pilus assembly protein TadD
MELMAKPAPTDEPPPQTEQSGSEAEPALAAEMLAPAASKEPKTALEFVEEIGPEAMASFDQTFHGVALTDGAVPGMFDETLPGSSVEPPPEPQRSYDQTLPGVPAAQLARDIGTDQPTPAAAQTVFTAGHARRPDRLYKWGLGGLGVLVLIAVFVFVYNVQTPVAPNTPSPWVARGIEAIPPPAELLPQAEAALPESPPETAVPVIDPAIESSGAIAAAGTEPQVTVEGGPEAAPEPAAPEPAATEAAVPAESAPPVAEPVVAPVADAGPAEIRTPEAPPSLVRIRRTRSASDHDRMLREAYSYYQAADYEAAAIHYLAVLNERPDTLDALLGMGSIALRQNDLQRAVDYFSRALRVDPRNQIAAGALIGLQRNPDPVASESALKFMLQENPDSAFLYFVLGNVYAAQSRWSEAQQAFFDAYRNDSANPDYALNLAASLDRLGQAQPALDYYGVALKLAEGQPAGFDPASVRARVQALSSTGGQVQ